MAESDNWDLVIILITGLENLKRLPSAFFLASTAAAGEQNVLMYFTGPATELLRKGVPETLFPLKGGQSMAGFMKLAEDNGVHMIGCAQSLDLNGMTASDLGRELPLINPSAALPSLAKAGRVLTW